MRTKIELDDELVKEAFRYTEVKTKRGLVHLALQEFIANHRRPDVRELWGTAGISPDYDYKRLRNEGP
ncbi:MAG TPA: type II toxin-antitoxin system VapB family antitoxin [Thermoanaerobaculia bacterium]|nr:type II toxin-antitoxin system VapB family antitoxin [Thermoanaerobaculia bacterium]